MTSPPLDYISPADLRERAVSYRMGGPSSEHTAKMLDDAANRIDALLADNARMVKALNTCRDVIVNLGLYFPEGSMGRADAELGIEEARQALSGANHD